jgi:DNA-binding XRE family transcriptional regulator
LSLRVQPERVVACYTTVITASQVKAARKLLGWTQQDCADKAGVCLDTVVHLEVGRKPILRTGEAIRNALDAAGVEFPQGGSARLKERE